MRGRGASGPSLERIDSKLYLQQLEQRSPAAKLDTFQKQNLEEERIKRRGPKVEQKKEEFEDERVNKLQNMMFALGKRIDSRTNLLQKIQYFPSVSNESKRCSDLFHHHNNLDLVSGLKDEHRQIGQAFQSLSENWKSVRIKSDTETNQIQVVCSLKVSDDKELQDSFEEMKTKIDPLCTSLFLVTTQASKVEHGQKEVKIEKVKGEDYLNTKIGVLDFKLGPFASLPTANIDNTTNMFKYTRHNVQKEDVVIDFDCNAGIYGLALGRLCKRVIGLDNAQIHVNNAILNAKMHDIEHDFRKGANVQNLSSILADLQYEGRNAVMLLHPQRLTTVPDKVIEAILTSNQIKKILLFSSNPPAEAFKHLVMLLKDGPFQLHRYLAFDILPGTGNLHTLFVLRNKIK